MNLPPQQKVMNILLRDEYSFDNFFNGPNDALVYGLKQWIAGEGHWFICLSGHEGSGRSHLLQAACLQLEIDQQSAIYLPLLELRELSPDILQGLETLGHVCIDDIEAITGNTPWEEALFHFYNKLPACGGRLLVTSKIKPTELNLHLADLKSRLNAGITYKLHELSDVDKKSVLKLRAKNRGFELSDEVARYIIGRANRTLPALMRVLDILDQSSLESKRKITVPFVKHVMDW